MDLQIHYVDIREIREKTPLVVSPDHSGWGSAGVHLSSFCLVCALDWAYIRRHILGRYSVRRRTWGENHKESGGCHTPRDRRQVAEWGLG